jgi:hypothetical protein
MIFYEGVSFDKPVLALGGTGPGLHAQVREAANLRAMKHRIPKHVLSLLRLGRTPTKTTWLSLLASCMIVEEIDLLSTSLVD